MAKGDFTFAPIDSFATSLSDLKGARRKDPFAVYDAITALGHFSAFEIERGLEKPVTMLFQRELLKNKLPDPGYPWVRCEATARGREWRAGRLIDCPDCAARGYLIRPISKHSGFADPCPRCDSSGWAPDHHP
jgi:hypothetical protein